MSRATIAFAIWLAACSVFPGLAAAAEIRWSRWYDAAAQSAVVIDSQGYALLAAVVWVRGAFSLAVTKYDRSGNEVWREQIIPVDRSFKLHDVAVDSDGAVYLAGTTASDALRTTPDVLAAERRGDMSGFVIKWREETRRVEWATYIGGTTQSNAYSAMTVLKAISVGADGTVFGVGATNTVDFPVTAGAMSESLQGDEDDVAFALASDGASLLWSTYVGGSDRESSLLINWAHTTEPLLQDIALDKDGNPVVASVTSSTDFPSTDDAWQGQLAGGRDLYIAKLDKDTGAAVWATYLGGSDTERGVRLAIDDDNRILLAASTNSGDFPATAGSFQPASPWISGGDLTVVAALTADGALDWSTYFASDSAACAGISACGSVVPYAIGVMGGTVAFAGRVDGHAIPTTANAPFRQNRGDSDAFVAVLDATGSTLDFASFIGGAAADFGTGLAYGADGELYLIGQTASPDFPLTTAATPRRGDGFAMLLAAPGALGALPKVQANEGPGPLSLRLGDEVRIDVSLLPRDWAGADADWWVAANTPFGWYSYSDELKRWVSVGHSHLKLIPTFQRPLADLLPQRVITTSGLGPGRYGVYFGIDTLPNGVLDMSHLWFTRAVVEIE